MTRFMQSLLFVVLSFSFTASVIAEEQWNPDPTGKGRYFQTGSVVPYPGARVVTELPADTVCASAGELEGEEFWNSTGPDKAIRSKLTGQAKVAVTPDGRRRFLCECARGYNELFQPPVASPPAAPPTVVPAPAAPAPTSTPPVVPPTSPVTVNVNVDNSNKVEEKLVPLETSAPKLLPLENSSDKKSNRRISKGKVAAWSATAITVAWGIWYFWCDIIGIR